jgi:ribosome biogenesis protein BMS1
VGKIARYIGTSNPSTICWRVNHPFIVCDRWEISQDNNYQDDELVDVNFYGYVRGASYRMNGRMHLVGMGDFFVR